MKGIYIYSFAKNIIWYKENNNLDEFIFGFLNDDTLYNSFSKSYNDKFISEKKIIAKFYKNIDEVDENVSILYLGKYKKENTLSEVNKKFKKKPILTIGEEWPFNSVSINFLYIQDRLKFELNANDFNQKDIKIGITLLKLAYNIYGQPNKTINITSKESKNAIELLNELEVENKKNITIENSVVKELIQQFENKENEIEKKKKEIFNKESLIKSMNKKIELQKAEMKYVKNKIDSSKKVLTLNSKVLSKKTNEILKLQNEFDTKNNDLLNKEAEINAKKIEIDLLNKEYERQSLDIISQNRTIKENKKDIASKSQKIESQEKVQLLLNSIVAILILFLTFSVYSYIRKKKANDLISTQKETLEKQNQVILTTNKEITDSINYAKRIQNAILPSTKVVKEYLNNSFIYYRPKDIVAGDFYWMEHTQNKTIFAVADCTGHGVPGAMVSVICNNSLNKSVLEFGLSEPGEILDKAREIVIQKFEKSEEKIYDGMDIALCTLEKKENNYELKYAGANNPLWIINNNEIKEIKADRQPIGNSKVKSKFTTHTLNLTKGDTIYIFTDGYVDQFGGEKGKKYKSKTLKSYLLSIQETKMSEQRKLLDDNFDNWRGVEEQIDDICMIGVRI